MRSGKEINKMAAHPIKSIEGKKERKLSGIVLFCVFFYFQSMGAVRWIYAFKMPRKQFIMTPFP